MNKTIWFLPLLLAGSGLVLAASLAPPRQAPRPAASHGGPTVTVVPGDEADAQKYYTEIRLKLKGFEKPTLRESSISDMLSYFGYAALQPRDLQSLDPAVLMGPELGRRVSNPQVFDSYFKDRPLQQGEILVTRFFAPKIVEVSDPPADHGYGWRKVLRFRARDGSRAKADALDCFYLLFNFASKEPTFPGGDAGQIQALLTPVAASPGHRPVYFLVFNNLKPDNPQAGKVGTFLEASFDFGAERVPHDRYYVPQACAQCHGVLFTRAGDKFTIDPEQKGGKVNYLDTDHWFDRQGDADFPRIAKGDVLVDPAPQAYDTFRKLNAEIAAQNEAAALPGKRQFALLAVRKWLALHAPGAPRANEHVPPLERGFGETGDPLWDGANATDRQLLPLLNQYCFRCHSSVQYHVFDKKTVKAKASQIKSRLDEKNPRLKMPQDRKLAQPKIDEIKGLIDKLDQQ